MLSVLCIFSPGDTCVWTLPTFLSPAFPIITLGCRRGISRRSLSRPKLRIFPPKPALPSVFPSSGDSNFLLPASQTQSLAPFLSPLSQEMPLARCDQQDNAKDVHALIPGTCDPGTSCGKRDFTDGIKIQALHLGDDPGLSGWVPYNHRTLQSTDFSLAGDRKDKAEGRAERFKA